MVFDLSWVGLLRFGLSRPLRKIFPALFTCLPSNNTSVQMYRWSFVSRSVALRKFPVPDAAWKADVLSEEPLRNPGRVQ